MPFYGTLKSYGLSGRLWSSDDDVRRHIYYVSLIGTHRWISIKCIAHTFFPPPLSATPLQASFRLIPTWGWGDETRSQTKWGGKIAASVSLEWGEKVTISRFRKHRRIELSLCMCGIIDEGRQWSLVIGMKAERDSRISMMLNGEKQGNALSPTPSRHLSVESQQPTGRKRRCVIVMRFMRTTDSNWAEQSFVVFYSVDCPVAPWLDLFYTLSVMKWRKLCWIWAVTVYM